ncbi:unnamed protein product [Brassica rapa subsp. narinosa]
MDGDRGGFGDIGGGIGAGGQQDKGQIKRMDSDSEDVDGVGCGGAGGGIGAGGIGAGGNRGKKGLNPYKHLAADIRKERLPPQDDLPPPPLRIWYNFLIRTSVFAITIAKSDPEHDEEASSQGGFRFVVRAIIFHSTKR